MSAAEAAKNACDQRAQACVLALIIVVYTEGPMLEFHLNLVLQSVQHKVVSDFLKKTNKLGVHELH